MNPLIKKFFDRGIGFSQYSALFYHRYMELGKGPGPFNLDIKRYFRYIRSYC